MFESTAKSSVIISRVDSRVTFALIVTLAVASISTGTEQEAAPENPHGNAMLCMACHTSAAGGLHFGGDVAQLCGSCHDGRRASREVHPVNLTPSATIVGRMLPEFPLRDGRLTCLTCHDVSRDCKAGPADAAPRHHLLRGWQASNPMVFCSHCHAPEDYSPFNAHDQVEAGQARTDTCVWCHADVPDVNFYQEEAAPQTLRDKSSRVCLNCHPMVKDHPTHSHMGTTPPMELLWHISAYELQPKLRLSFEERLKYTSTVRRAPRAIPFDGSGRIACYTCHNPHEKGLLPDANPRSLGAEPKHAAMHRLRAREGKVCVVCHDK